MGDFKSKEARSQNMSAIRNRDTKPEIFIRKKLHALGYRYRVAYNKIPGHPDLYFAKYNAAIFIHGCFWHSHPNCKYAYSPKSRIEFWEKKFADNKKRDDTVSKNLSESGIRQLIIWECAIKSCQKKGADPQRLISKVIDFLNSDTAYLEIGPNAL